jgi:transposase
MCCFFDTKTRKHSFLNAPTERNYLNPLFMNHKIDLVVMEACGPSSWINDLASSHGLKTLVCSTTGRLVSAYFGLVPRQYPSGETDR